jgi:DNA repair photolyase
MRKLNEAGIACGMMVAPIIPNITDDPAHLKEVVRAGIDAGATHITPILLHLRPVVREHFMGWLNENHPELVTTYEGMYAHNVYGPKADRQRLSNRVRGLVAEAGGLRLITPPPQRHRRWGAKPADPQGPRTTQLELL